MFSSGMGLNVSVALGYWLKCVEVGIDDANIFL